MEDRVVVLGVGVRGPLAGYVSGFAEVLVDRGYAPGSVLQQLCLVSQLSRWLDAEGLGVDGLTELEAERFLAARRARGVRLFRSLLALEPILGYLRGLGVAPVVADAGAVTPVEELLERYRRYLLVERALTVGARGCTWGRCVRSLSGLMTAMSLRLTGWVLRRSARSCWMRRAGCRERRSGRSRPRCGRCLGSCMWRG